MALLLTAFTAFSLLFLSSLYRTTPIYVPYISKLPIYHNQWQYTPPDTLKQPNSGQLTAAYVTFSKGDTQSLNDLRMTVRSMEDTFNSQHNYPYIIFTMDDLSTEYMELVSSLTKSDVLFEKVSKEEYESNAMISSWDAFMKKMPEDDMMHSLQGSRFMAGPVFRSEHIKNLDYIWALDIGGEFTCPIDYDPFVYMKEHNKAISLSPAVYEETQPSTGLFQAVVEFRLNQTQWNSSTRNSLLTSMLSDNQNGCTIWSKLQIYKTSVFTDARYQAFFDMIDNGNGIINSKWTDTMIQSVGASLLLNKDEVHMWDMGYIYRYRFRHCPSDSHRWAKCYCRPNIDDNKHLQNACIRDV
ncbi:nucleotide-diphospho-sugar transferase [Pilobolus umbonatus]|nr:nucleotide-diphospho-sugar transferase [Pilobolus umbonatus]